MLKIQETYLNYLINIKEEIKKTDFSDDVKETFKIQIYSDAIKNTELIVPIVGSFSSGKSTFLNSFLGQNYLPVGITPETSLATELRYSNEEYIEAVMKNDEIKKYSISDFEEIKKSASKYKYIRIFIDNDKIKSIEPLILVDMPGFESPLDLHNQAIFEYINRGVHFIVLTSVEDGTITRSMVRQLSDIQEYGRDFSFFLSKVNLRPNLDVQNILNDLKEQIEEQFDISKEIIPIDNNSGKSLKKILSSIEPEKLFQNLFINELKENYHKISGTINTAISSMNKSKEDNEVIISELEKSLNEQINERERIITNAKEKYSDSNINRIVDSVGNELSLSMNELVNTASNGGKEALSKSISEIVRHSLIEKLKNSINSIGNEVINDFANNLSDINKSFSNFSMSDNWVNIIAENSKTLLNSVQSGLNNIVDNRTKKENTQKLYKAITTTLAITTTIINPLLEIIIVFLPELLSFLFDALKKKKQEEQIRTTLQTDIIPSIKRELRTKLPEIFNQQIEEMIVSISEQFEKAISNKKEIINETQKDIGVKITDIEKTISKYTEVKESILALSNKILF